MEVLTILAQLIYLNMQHIYVEDAWTCTPECVRERVDPRVKQAPYVSIMRVMPLCSVEQCQLDCSLACRLFN